MRVEGSEGLRVEGSEGFRVQGLVLLHLRQWSEDEAADCFRILANVRLATQRLAWSRVEDWMFCRVEA